jgi:predicted  nucleic acid-binding Zn-ribbon protein
MKEQLMALYELQSLDVKIAQANTKLAALDGASALKRRLAAAKFAAESAESALVAQEIELKDAELKLKTVDEKRSTFEKRLYGGAVTNPKELGAVEKEVKILKSQQEQLDGRTLELYDSVDKTRSAAQAARHTVTETETKLKAALATEAAERAGLESELKEFTSLREAAAATVTDRALMSRYEAVRKRSGNTGIAKLARDRCEGCHTSVTSFTTRKLFEDKEIVSCENCGRILVLDPDA